MRKIEAEIERIHPGYFRCDKHFQPECPICRKKT
jgi:hypothetical protein